MPLELTFLKCRKTDQNPKYLMSDGLFNLGDKFCHAPQNSRILDFYFTMC